jgi:hypothetical protein
MLHCLFLVPACPGPAVSMVKWRLGTAFEMILQNKEKKLLHLISGSVRTCQCMARGSGNAFPNHNVIATPSVPIRSSLIFFPSNLTTHLSKKLCKIS